MGKRRLPAELDQCDKIVRLILRTGGRFIFSSDPADKKKDNGKGRISETKACLEEKNVRIYTQSFAAFSKCGDCIVNPLTK